MISEHELEVCVLALGVRDVFLIWARTLHRFGSSLRRILQTFQGTEHSQNYFQPCSNCLPTYLEIGIASISNVCYNLSQNDTGLFNNNGNVLANFRRKR